MRALVAAVAMTLALAACSSQEPGPRSSWGTGPASTGQAAPSGSGGSTMPDRTGPTGAAGSTGATGATGPHRTRFAGRISTIPPAIERDMRGKTWEPGCPVGFDGLRLLRFNYHGIDGQIHRGPLVVNAASAEDLLGVFETLFRAGFELKHVDLASKWRPNGPVDTTRSVTASFDCRPALNPDGTPTGSFSMHSYGLAVDVNPLQNPYVGPDGSVQRPAAEAYVDRSQDLPGMIHEGDVVVDAFASIGWEWGGDWTTKKDYMHFSINGR